MVRINRRTDQYSELITQLHMARQNKIQVEDKIKEIETELIHRMEASSRKSASDGSTRVTYVRPTKVKIDEAGLRKALGAKVYDRFTVAKLDQKKLEAALEKEEIEAEKVSPYVTEVVGTPYLRVTESKEGA